MIGGSERQGRRSGDVVVREIDGNRKEGQVQDQVAAAAEGASSFAGSKVALEVPARCRTSLMSS